METRRSKRLSTKEIIKPVENVSNQSKKKSNYFDPDFSEESDTDSDSPLTKSRLPKRRKKKNESDNESSSNEFVQKPKTLSEILQSQSELKLSSEESDSSVETPSPKKKKKTAVTKRKKTNSDEIVESNCKTELLSSDVTNEPESKPEYFDFTALVNKVKACTEKVEEVTLEVKEEPIEKPEKKTKKNKKSVKQEVENKEELKVSELLAMGEDTDLTAKDIEESVTQAVNEDYEIPKQVEVMLDAPSAVKKKKGTDLEMALRRRLNFIRRENQIYIHKVHILCLIAHGKYISTLLNSPDLLGVALSLLPSDKCYPPKRMDMKYLEDLISWFTKKIKIKKDPIETRKEALLVSLQKQFHCLEADSKNDLCFMFICIVRALGVKCRLIINLDVVPLKPSSDQLLPINTTKEATPGSSKKTEQKSQLKLKEENEKSSKKENQSSKNPERKPQKLKEPTKEEKNKSIPKSSEKKQDTPKKDTTPKKESSNQRSTRSRNSEKIEKETLVNSSSRPSRSKSVDLKKSASSKETHSSDSKKQSDYFKDASKSSRRSERVASKSNYFSNKSAQPKIEKLGKKIPPKTKGKKPEPANSVEEMSTSSDSDDDDTFLPAQKKKLDRRVLSSEEDVSSDKKPDSNKNKNKNNYWAEVFLEAEEKWFCVDVAKKSYHCIQQLYNGASHPVRYVLAFNNDQTVKDVTKRYVPQFLSVTRKQRVDDTWWQTALDPYKPPPTPQNHEEDEELDRVLEEQPLPTSISEYKNHPLYALERHLLKFQAIYPPDAPTLGYIKGEPVYSRLCVHQLHGREMWIKEAKVVKMGEKPYKIVKGRQKKDKFGIGEGPKDLELFGLWQTEDYDPPVAQNGIVPRNSFGNVELFKPCMLPKGTVYLQIPGLQKIANKLNIDCAAAITGFEYSTNGWSYPVKEGFVVCEEYKDILLDAYNQEVEEAEKKEKRKREERVWANWKRLIKGLFIQEKLKRKYNFGGASTSDSKVQSK